ncbi:MAG: phosphatidylethanolamine N-methyltransferase family protein [Gammaproteobacteria bacterium]|nr:phosphatidylethanolamine N-methyltransferase family protein [Gammaproteobacteria bacterium]
MIIGGILSYSGLKLTFPIAIKLIVLVVLLIATVPFVIGLLINLRCPKIGLWPPPTSRSWQFWFIWISYTIGAIGVPVIGLLDRGTLGLNNWYFRAIGIALLVLAVPLNEWSMRTLSDYQTLGLKGNLITNGPYRYSRNPQYVAEILTFLGIVVVTNSTMALIIGALIMVWFLLAPFAEEPWLEQKFGKEYQSYCDHVPRFIGVGFHR